MKLLITIFNYLVFIALCLLIKTTEFFIGEIEYFTSLGCFVSETGAHARIKLFISNGVKICKVNMSNDLIKKYTNREFCFHY